VVTSVKNQGQCASCYAFSSTGAIEGAWALYNGTLLSLSQQQLVDCSYIANNSGCNGGSISNAYNYVIMNGGIDSESDYPYSGNAGNCNTVTPYSSYIQNFIAVENYSDSKLFDAVNIGPVSVAIQSDLTSFQFYSGGVYNDAYCCTDLDHGVLVVGYGVLDSQPYWIVKNSWSAAWGIEGYIYLARIDGAGECGINMEPSYPVIA